MASNANATMASSHASASRLSREQWEDLKPYIVDLHRRNFTVRRIAIELEGKGYRTRQVCAYKDVLEL